MDQQRYSFLGFPERLDPWQRSLPYALLLAVTFALYGTTLYFRFIWDDSHYILDNYEIRGLSPAHLRAIWATSYFGQYNPLHLTLLAVLYSLSGLEPFGYHLAQLLLHAASVCLLYFVLTKIESQRIALLASLLFAVYPPNIENVAWISETKSTLAFLFFLLSFWAFVRLRTRKRWADGVWCALFLALSLISKINTVVAPAIFLLYCYREQGRGKREQSETGPSRSRLGFAVPCSLSPIPWLVGFFLISAVFTAIHLVTSSQESHAAARTLLDAAIPDTSLPLSIASGGYLGGINVHLLNLPRLLLFYTRMAFFPYPLSAWHMVRVSGELNWGAGAAWIALLGMLWLLYRSPRDLQFWELWFAVFLAPVLQIIPNPIWVAERYLYIPAIGAFVLWGKFFFYISDRFAKLWLRLSWGAALTAILLAFAWQTHAHVPVWRNDLTLWITTTKTCNTSAYCHDSLGQSLLANGYYDLAVKELYQAVQIRADPNYLIDLGDAYAIGFGDYRRALLAYDLARQSKELLPLEFWAKMAKTAYMSGDLMQAMGLIEDGQKIDADEPTLLVVKGFVQWKQGQREEARQSLRRAVAATGQTSNAAGAINLFWKNPAEVGQLLAGLGPL